MPLKVEFVPLAMALPPPFSMVREPIGPLNSMSRVVLAAIILFLEETLLPMSENHVIGFSDKAFKTAPDEWGW